MENYRTVEPGPQAFPPWAAWQMQGSPAPLLPATAASSGFFSTGTGVGAAGTPPPSGLRPFGSGGHHQLRFPPTA
jgi:AP2-like factor (euAP2 lineage)